MTSCCTEACSSYMCPAGFILRAGAASLRGQTTASCCDEACSSFACPLSKVPKANASSIAGHSSSECCEEACGLQRCTPDNISLQGMATLLISDKLLQDTMTEQSKLSSFLTSITKAVADLAGVAAEDVELMLASSRRLKQAEPSSHLQVTFRLRASSSTEASQHMSSLSALLMTTTREFAAEVLKHMSPGSAANADQVSVLDISLTATRAKAPDTACQAWQVARESSCFDCPPGSVPDAFQTGCELCPEGHIASGSQCSPCSEGKRPSETQSSCVAVSGSSDMQGGPAIAAVVCILVVLCCGSGLLAVVQHMTGRTPWTARALLHFMKHDKLHNAAQIAPAPSEESETTKVVQITSSSPLPLSN